MSPDKEYLKWRQGPTVGCLFARKTASKPTRYAQRIAHIPTATSPERVAKHIATTVSTIIAEGGSAAALLLFPELRALEETARIMLALNMQPEWTVKSSPVPAPPRGFIALNVTRQIRFGKTTCPSEALVLGNHREFPATRRAPVTAMELFVGDPRPMGPLDDKPTTKANLAHMPLDLPTHEMFMAMWDGSFKGRSRSLGGEDNRAKARVSLAIPLALANRIGCGT